MGTAQLAVRHDVEVWCFALVGSADCWPVAASFGGCASRIGISAFRLCDSSSQFFEDCTTLPDGADEAAKAKHLVDTARTDIQARIDDLLSHFARGNRLDDDDDDDAPSN